MAANIFPDQFVRLVSRFPILCPDRPFYFGNTEKQLLQSYLLCVDMDVVMS